MGSHNVLDNCEVRVAPEAVLRSVERRVR